MTNKKFKKIDKLAAILKHIKPEHAPADDAFKDWFAKTAQPTILDQCLSELRRHDGFPPRIIGFMEGGTTGVVNVADPFKGNWGNNLSKDITAYVHEMSARVPGTLAACFISETWILRDLSAEEYEPWRGKSFKDHPDRAEGVSISALRYNWDTNLLMQLFVTVEVLKVFAHPRLPRHYMETKYGEIKVIDPVGGKDVFKGRFIPSDKNKEIEDDKSD